MHPVAGICHPRFTRVAEAFARQLENYGGGAAVSVYHRGEPVVDMWGGARNWDGEPWQEDTLSVSFSTTKGVVSTLLHQLAAEGRVDYDAPVATYWPEFAARGKEWITVRDLLTHRAGLYRMDNLGLGFDDLTDWDKVCAALAAAPADESTGPYSVYHALTFGWLVGEVVRRVSGSSVTELTRSALAEPLGLDGFYIGVPDEQHHRVADLLMGHRPGTAPKQPQQKNLAANWERTLRRNVRDTLGGLAQRGWAPDFYRFEKAVTVKGFHARKLTDPAVLRSAMPAFNGVFSASGLARFYGALANGGKLGDARILPAEWIPVISERQVFDLDRALYSPMSWRLGYHQPFVFSLRRPRRAFGHFGFGGSGAWADPERNLSVALTVNKGSGTPWGDMRILKVGAAALASVR